MRRRRIVEEGDPVDPDRIVEGPEPVDERPENWWRPWAAVLALLALAAIGVVLWLVLRDSGGDKATMPNVVGMQEDAAVERVRQENLEPNVEGEESDRPEGTVISQDPGAGTQVEEGEEVVLAVSRG